MNLGGMLPIAQTQIILITACKSFPPPLSAFNIAMQ